MAPTMSDTFTLSFPSLTEIAATRRFPARRALVFKAHTSCEHIRNWWGLRAHTMTSCEMDFRPGGQWRFVSSDGAGGEYAFRGEYREIVPEESITWTFEFEGYPGHVSVEMVTFEDDGDGTLVRVLSRYASQEDRDGMIASGMEGGARETYDRLEEYAETLS